MTIKITYGIEDYDDPDDLEYASTDYGVPNEAISEEVCPDKWEIRAPGKTLGTGKTEREAWINAIRNQTPEKAENPQDPGKTVTREEERWFIQLCQENGWDVHFDGDVWRGRVEQVTITVPRFFRHRDTSPDDRENRVRIEFRKFEYDDRGPTPNSLPSGWRGFGCRPFGDYCFVSTNPMRATPKECLQDFYQALRERQAEAEHQSSMFAQVVGDGL